MTPVNIAAAFKKTGIFPFDQHVFNEGDFLASHLTDRPPPPESLEELPSTSTSETKDKYTRKRYETTICESCGNTRISKESQRTSNTQNKKGKTMIATDTPEKDELQEIRIKKTAIETVKGNMLSKVNDSKEEK
ncbi:uncharacterized protein LOC126888057 [Diabrotica virgifera virgifera]|uniref:Uncharacterized protein n=1 Tax=Diabrotica virgifera virgifera TaxID=50390 RepID=A0ABM5KPB4_DIAVI|nr:uncharacterized protein LOC126888057 [Diabrotica virgifera virgifera]